eukprot:COSAG01_NODE_4349_length_5115_cov_2.076555_3_plen_109_part_00
MVVKRSYAHKDFDADYNSYRGNAYGLANTLMQTAYLKPSLKPGKLPVSRPLRPPPPPTPPRFWTVVSKACPRATGAEGVGRPEPVLCGAAHEPGARGTALDHLRPGGG